MIEIICKTMELLRAIYPHKLSSYVVKENSDIIFVTVFELDGTTHTARFSKSKEEIDVATYLLDVFKRELNRMIFM